MTCRCMRTKKGRPGPPFLLNQLHYLLDNGHMTDVFVFVTAEILAVDLPYIRINLSDVFAAIGASVPSFVDVLSAVQCVTPAIEDLHLVTLQVETVFCEHRLEVIIYSIKVRREGSWNEDLSSGQNQMAFHFFFSFDRII